MGRTTGNYELLKKLGEGGVGEVFAAVDHLLGRKVAIKSLRPELGNDRTFVERFLAEATNLARLNHPNIATLYTLHRDGAELFMIMELVRGSTLEDVLVKSGRLAVQDCLALIAQTTDGLSYAHRMGIIHRDIKPANLMITGDGMVKIMDFGIARARGSQRLTRQGHIVGSLAYMAPEQVQGNEGDERSDLYSLAIVLYEMLSGQPPFVSDSDFELLRAHMDTPPPRLIERIPDIDPHLEATVLKALSKNPADRFPSIEEFARATGAEGLRRDSPALVRERFASLLPEPVEEASEAVHASAAERLSRMTTVDARPRSSEDTTVGPAPTTHASQKGARKGPSGPMLALALAGTAAVGVGGFIVYDQFLSGPQPTPVVAAKEPAEAPSSRPADVPPPSTPSEIVPSSAASTPTEPPPPSPVGSNDTATDTLVLLMQTAAANLRDLHATDVYLDGAEKALAAAKSAPPSDDMTQRIQRYQQAIEGAQNKHERLKRAYFSIVLRVADEFDEAQENAGLADINQSSTLTGDKNIARFAQMFVDQTRQYRKTKTLDKIQFSDTSPR